MITRHFYESDSVCATLQRAILLGRSKEAAFWCQELIDSLEEDLARQCLFETWIYFVNFMNATWFKKHSENANIHELCYNLSIQEEHDMSTIGILLLQDEPVDRILGNKVYSKEEYRDMAIKQGRARSAWWSSSCKQKTSECGMLVFQCSPQKEISWQEVPITIQKQLYIWSTKKGRRSRREFGIPYSQLYSHRPTSVERLYTIEHTIVNDGCTFWREALSIGGNQKGSWSSDDALEAFYALHFPDDIPDEWSSKDQEKSHCLVNKLTETYSLSRWIRSWFPPRTLMRSVWGFESQIAEKAINITWSSGTFQTACNSIPVWTAPDSKKQLSGCKRIYITNE